MLPLIARNLLEQIALLSTATVVFADKLLAGLKANRADIESKNEQSLSLATVLAPRIGYDKAAEIAKESFKTRKTVRELCFEKKVLPRAELEKALDLMSQTEPSAENIGSAGG